MVFSDSVMSKMVKH